MKILNIEESKYSVETKPISKNYEYDIISMPPYKFDKVKLLNNDICILPFETDPDGNNLITLLLNRKFDFIKKASALSVLIEPRLPEDDSNLDVVKRTIQKHLQIPVGKMPLENIFYLGILESSNYISMSLPAYAINITGILGNKENLFVVDEEFGSYMERIKYVDILRGKTNDVLVNAMTMSLLSNFI